MINYQLLLAILDLCWVGEWYSRITIRRRSKLDVCFSGWSTLFGKNTFTYIILDVAKPFFGKRIISIGENKNRSEFAPCRITDVWRDLRDNCFTKLNSFRRDSCQENRKSMVRARSLYTNCANRCRRDADRQSMSDTLNIQMLRISGDYSEVTNQNL